ncbi:VCBS repeat-containing protein [Cyclobacterium plantarum]|uniref:VCBS repeat-containing protein n=1 Tax=Cyclobacterium plantarum TaxID=2716263 RepID=A0ABX0H5G3_9BACT|nr:VCBS repeat-containing protein [Cyclobacterium plantarum]NHE57090.1 VCBS repeat-containing protein [Cyclobacterium plantarum]
MRHLAVALLFFTFLGCSEEKDTDYLFTPQVSKLDFTNKLSETPNISILYYLYFYNGGGVAIGDINNDGLQDIYFTGNQVPNKLFLNKGDMEFEDITEKAGVAGTSDWNTGVSMADVNGDGHLDIYVCAVVGIHGLQGKNELFINNGDLTFAQEGKKYGLDFQNYSTMAAFFDYDNDGDLDMYLLNHSVHTVNSYGPSEIRNDRIDESGDKLLKNEGGIFVDVSQEAGIYGGANGYGLGLATSDFNNDGYTDLYISNDFHEDDYYYINNGDGTFSEQLKEKFSQVSRFSMGNDASDINHDGFVDILTLDMLPEDEKVLKSSMSDDPIYTHDLKIERLKYHPQYARNMLQINRSGEYFQEIALFGNVAATDWSWSPLIADFDLDGKQDLFISTGIARRPNDHDYINYISSEEIERKFNSSSVFDQEALKKMPPGKVKNYIFEGREDLRFSDKSGKWISDTPNISNGAAWADLDNDGDLDLVTNNLNEPATLYLNNLKENSAYLKIKVNFTAPNTFGIGTKVISWHQGKMQLKQLYTTRGFQSSSEPLIHFGYGSLQQIDSLLVIWPDNTFEMKYEIAVNQTVKLKPQEDRKKLDYSRLFPKPETWFRKVAPLPGLDYEHQENRFIDFNRQRLIPYKISDKGPAVVVKDLDGDGREDIFFGGATGQPARIFLQTPDRFVENHVEAIGNDSIYEDVSATIEDLNNDGRNDLFIVSAGGEFTDKNETLRDRLYINSKAGFSKRTLPSYFENGSVVKAQDYDKDGNIDLFIGGAAVANDFGKLPRSYLLINKKDSFDIIENKDLEHIGMVTDALWTDFDGDGWEDLIVVGEWMSPRFLRNQNGVLKDITNDLIDQNLNGLWQTIIPFDINGDGNMDFLLGNWGLNTKFKATQNSPLKMYYSDFDDNGRTETIVAYEKNGKYYTVAGLDELGSQMSVIRRKFTAYSDFAGKPVEEIFDEAQLENASLLTVHNLASGYLLNSGDGYTFEAFETSLQVAPLTSFLKYDFNGDGKEEVLAGGNYFGVTPYHGRYGSLSGNIITAGGKILDGDQLGLNFTQKAVRDLAIINFDNEHYALVTYNNEKPELYKLKFGKE